MKLRIVCLVVGFLLSVLSMAAQTSGSGPASAQVPTLAGTGTKDYVPLWLSSTKLGSSKLFQTGGKVGIGTKTPAATLDVNGTVNAATSFNLGGNLFAYGSSTNANAFLGFAGNTTTTSFSNTAAGYEALHANTTGDFNTAAGVDALISNTTGGTNTATGAGALYHNTTGSSNTASGFNALTNNTANYNDAFGYQALVNNTTGSPNDAFGSQALYSNTIGIQNDAFGYEALYNTTGGSANAAFGYAALYNNTTGSNNVAFGFQTMFFNTTGITNTAIGADALIGNTTGNYNTAVGAGALNGNTTGSDLTCIGYLCTAGADGLRNATAIGAHAVVGASNSLVLGGTGKYAVKVGIGTTKPSNILTVAQGAGHPVSDGWETFSSRRWKTNIQTLEGALGKVEQLRGVSYDLKADGKHEVGVIAEEVGAVVPEVVTWDENGKDAQSVDYSRLTALLIEAVKQQQREIRDLKSELRATRQTLQKVKAHVDATQPTLVAAK
jgi:hypothetical protein